MFVLGDRREIRKKIGRTKDIRYTVMGGCALKTVKMLAVDFSFLIIIIGRGLLNCLLFDSFGCYANTLRRDEMS